MLPFYRSQCNRIVWMCVHEFRYLNLNETNEVNEKHLNKIILSVDFSFGLLFYFS